MYLGYVKISSTYKLNYLCWQGYWIWSQHSFRCSSRRQATSIEKKGKKKLSITLPVIVTFHMSCHTLKEDQRTTFSAAIGNNVAVIFLIGISFINGSGMSIDCNDGHAEIKALNCAPFSLVYRSPQRGLPPYISVEIADSNAPHSDTSITMKINKIKATNASDGSTNIKRSSGSQH